MTMESQKRRYSSDSWIILGILTVAIALLTLVAVRHLHHQRTTGYEKSSRSKSPSKTAERSKPGEKNVLPSENSAAAPDRTIKELVRAWNQGHADDIAKMFSSDGVLIIPAGSQIQSRAEIERTIADKRAGMLKDTTLSNTVDDVSQSDADRATVKGTYQLEGLKILGFTNSATGSYVLHQIRREGRWLISRAEVKTGNPG